MRLALILMLAASCGAAQARPAIPAGAHYVALGSSFAAGPGITVSADTPPNRCTRSVDNYARQVARKLKLDLSDVSCGGATTGHILGPWNELPPQLDALRPDTKLVTITIGGNDVGYIAGLFKAACAADASAALCHSMAARRAAQVAPVEPDEAAWQTLEARFDQIIAEVKRRSPDARLIFVDYLTILPPKTICALTPADPEGVARARVKAARLAALTARAAARGEAGLVRASRLSAKHHACASRPWTTGFTTPGVPYHPTLKGMTAVSAALERVIRKP